MGISCCCSHNDERIKVASKLNPTVTSHERRMREIIYLFLMARYYMVFVTYNVYNLVVVIVFYSLLPTLDAHCGCPCYSLLIQL